jgi:catechol 2,3-dioxygenase-like lactoylglutathione lyase family enzyme
MDVLASRILLRPRDPARSREFYRDVLGLAVYREFGDPADPGVVFFLGNGLLELSGHASDTAGDEPSDSAGGEPNTGLWLQVRDVAVEHERLLATGAEIVRAPVLEPWGLIEMWLRDPDGMPIAVVEIPAGHPLRRDQRAL